MMMNLKKFIRTYILKSSAEITTENLRKAFERQLLKEHASQYSAQANTATKTKGPIGTQ